MSMQKYEGKHKGAAFSATEREDGGITLVRRSPFSGRLHALDLDITLAQLLSYYEGGALIQNAFPNLNADQREFIMTGITSSEWDSTFLD